MPDEILAVKYNQASGILVLSVDAEAKVKNYLLKQTEAIFSNVYRIYMLRYRKMQKMETYKNTPWKQRKSA